MTNTLPETVEVNQTDRDAAAGLYSYFRDPDYAGWIRAGTNAGGDYDWVILLLARHRQQAVAEERATEWTDQAVIEFCENWASPSGLSQILRFARMAEIIRTPSTASSEQETPA